MYKSSFSFTATPAPSSFILTYNNTKHVFPNGIGTLAIPFYEGSPCQCDRRFSISTDEEDPGYYTVQIAQTIPENGSSSSSGSGGVSAIVWTNVDLILQPLGFLPFDCDNPPSEDAIPFQLYGWTIENNIWLHVNAFDGPITNTVYTTTTTPTTTSNIYTRKGIEIVELWGSVSASLGNWEKSAGLIINSGSIGFKLLD